MAESLRGDGLARVHGALDRLEANPLGLDRARLRFSQSPPPYTSNPSGTTTRSASPDTRSDEQRYREQRRYRLIRERAASLSQKQFEAQVEEERKRIWYADPRTRMSQYRSIDTTFDEDARQIIMKRWAEQGIWKNKWGDTADGLWKHEEPLEIESEPDTRAASTLHPFSFGMLQKPLQPKPRRSKINDKKHQVAEWRAVQQRELGPLTLNLRAYKNIKNTWTKRGIWNAKWGILPGMPLKHEEPLDEASDYFTPVPANPLVNGSHHVGEAPTRRIFGSPSPVLSNDSQSSSVINMSEQGPSADAILEDRDAERLSSTSNSPRPKMGKHLRPTTRHISRPSKKKPSHIQTQPVASISLGPVHSSKVSKANKKKKPGPRRQPNAPQDMSSGDEPLLPRPDFAIKKPPTASVPPRRSNRIQMPEAGEIIDPTRIASTASEAYGRIKAEADGYRSSEIYGLGETPGHLPETALESRPREGEKGIAITWQPDSLLRTSDVQHLLW